MLFTNKTKTKKENNNKTTGRGGVHNFTIDGGLLILYNLRVKVAINLNNNSMQYYNKADSKSGNNNLGYKPTPKQAIEEEGKDGFWACVWCVVCLFLTGFFWLWMFPLVFGS